MARILVVDDNTHDFNQAKMWLESAGHVVERLEALTDLVETIEAEPPEIVLFDPDLAGLPATAFARYLKNVVPRGIRIVVYSREPRCLLCRVVAEMFGDAVLPKGLPPEEFRDRFRRGIGAPYRDAARSVL